jgi:nucleoid-associated protein YgaU
VGAAPPPPHALAPPAPTTTYVVRPGDCLWRIAARALGPGTSNRAVDAGWRAIYAENRASIGDDPGLIHPGLVLTLPPLANTR